MRNMKLIQAGGCVTRSQFGKRDIAWNKRYDLFRLQALYVTRFYRLVLRLLLRWIWGLHCCETTMLPWNFECQVTLWHSATSRRLEISGFGRIVKLLGCAISWWYEKHEQVFLWVSVIVLLLLHTLNCYYLVSYAVALNGQHIFISLILIRIVSYAVVLGCLLVWNFRELAWKVKCFDKHTSM
jgi:hypothetical protein